MEESSGRLGRTLAWISGMLFLYLVLYVALDVGLVSGFVTGAILWFIWGLILKATAFMSGRDAEFTLTVSANGREDFARGDDQQLSPSVPASREVVPRNPSRDVHKSVGRIIGADARRRVALAQVLRDGAPVPGRTETKRDEDREFADFLRSTPF